MGEWIILHYYTTQEYKLHLYYIFKIHIEDVNYNYANKMLVQCSEINQLDFK